MGPYAFESPPDMRGNISFYAVEPPGDQGRLDAWGGGGGDQLIGPWGETYGLCKLINLGIFIRRKGGNSDILL